MKSKGFPALVKCNNRSVMIPSNVEQIAPVLVAFSQNSPNTNGTVKHPNPATVNINNVVIRVQA